MKEIDKLKNRLQNIHPNVKEYRMTIEEARLLAQEFDQLEREMAQPVIPESVEIVHQIMDGGTFD